MPRCRKMKTPDATPLLHQVPLSAADLALKDVALQAIADVIRFEGVKAAFARLKMLTECFADRDAWPQIFRECRKAIAEARQQQEQEERERKQQQNLQHIFGEHASTRPGPPTEKQLARALMAVNGHNRAIDNQRAWLGACLLLGWKYGFSRNLSECCEQIGRLPIDWGQMEVKLKYGSIREFAFYKFTKERYEDWPTLTPRSEERTVFEKSLAVAQELDKEITKAKGGE